MPWLDQISQINNNKSYFCIHLGGEFALPIHAHNLDPELSSSSEYEDIFHSCKSNPHPSKASSSRYLPKPPDIYARASDHVITSSSFTYQVRQAKLAQDGFQPTKSLARHRQKHSHQASTLVQHQGEHQSSTVEVKEGTNDAYKHTVNTPEHIENASENIKPTPEDIQNAYLLLNIQKERVLSEEELEGRR